VSKRREVEKRGEREGSSRMGICTGFVVIVDNYPVNYPKWA
jgi:hypothetical protein